MRPPKPGDWILAPADGQLTEEREVATILRIEPGELLIAPQAGGPPKRIASWQARTPSDRPLDGRLDERRGRLR